MTSPLPEAIETTLVRAADLPLSELLALRASGDAVLDHCLRRLVEEADSGGDDHVAAFNAAPLQRRPRP